MHSHRFKAHRFPVGTYLIHTGVLHHTGGVDQQNELSMAIEIIIYANTHFAVLVGGWFC